MFLEANNIIWVVSSQHFILGIPAVTLSKNLAQPSHHYDVTKGERVQPFEIGIDGDRRGEAVHVAQETISMPSWGQSPDQTGSPRAPELVRLSCPFSHWLRTTDRFERNDLPEMQPTREEKIGNTYLTQNGWYKHHRNASQILCIWFFLWNLESWNICLWLFLKWNWGFRNDLSFLFLMLSQFSINAFSCGILSVCNCK